MKIIQMVIKIKDWKKKFREKINEFSTNDEKIAFLDGVEFERNNQ